MARGLNTQQRQFVEELVSSGNQTEAYLKVYPSCKNNSAARSSASKLLTNPNIIAYRDQLLANRANEKIAKAEEVLEMLTAGMRGELKEQFGLDMEVGDRIKCAELLGKRYGLFRERLEVKSVNIADTLKAARERARKNGKG